MTAAVFFGFVGLSCLVQARQWYRLILEFAAKPHRVLPHAVWLLAFGMLSLPISKHYEPHEGVLPTIVGSLVFLFAIILLTVPQVILGSDWLRRGAMVTVIRGWGVALIGFALLL